MKKDVVNYREGTLFLVPLRDAGFLRGLVCRLDGKGVVFGHFFLPRLESQLAPLPDDVLHSDCAILSGFFGDLGLTKGHWPLTGELEAFDRETWPLPVFVREVAGQPYVREFNDDLEAISERKMPHGSLPAETCRDSVMGYGFVEIKLTKLLESSVAR